MMKLLLITCPVTRHQYTANAIAEALPVDGVILQHRGRSKDQTAWSAKETELSAEHFRKRDEAEDRVLGPLGHTLRVQPQAKILDVHGNSLSAPETEAFVRGIAPDVIVTLGCTIVGPKLRLGTKVCFNLHLGMSPRYRGAAGFFWPIYNMDPERIATSILILEDTIDGGPIVHHSRPDMSATDGVHDIACKTIVAGASDLVRVLKWVAAGNDLVTVPQKRVGRVYYEADYHPRHLNVTHAVMKDGLIADYLAHKTERDKDLGRELVRNPGLE